jgi:diguanylate cyclase (GGDEF)-like protein
MNSGLSGTAEGSQIASWVRLHRALMPDYNRKATAYWWTFVSMGVAVLTYSVVAMLALPTPDLMQVLVGVVFTSFAAIFPVRIASSKISFAAGETFIFLLLLLHGPAAAALAAAAEGLVASMRTSKRWTSRIASPAIASVVMFGVGSLLQMAISKLHTWGLYTPGLLLGATVLFSLLYFLLDALLMTAPFYLKRSQWPIWRDLYSSFGGFIFTTSASASAACLMFLAFAREGMGVLITAVPILLLLMITSHYFFRQHEAQEKAEAKILAAKNQLEAVLDAIPDSLYEVGADGRIYRYHSRRNDILTIPPDGVEGKLMSEVLPPAAAEVCLSALSEAAKLGGSTGKSYGLQLPEGERRFELSISVMHNDVEQDRRFILLSRDITSRKIAEDEIKYLAYYDFLTQLPNRRLLYDRLKHAMASTVRNKKYGALLIIDLDNFKTLNDTLGHDVGDLLLQNVSERLTACVREGDTVARLGGDEFVVMLEDLSEAIQEAADSTKIVGEKIAARLNQPYQLVDHPYLISASIGATMFSNVDLSVDDLLKRADLAMYQAKMAGRNTMRFFDPEMQAAVMKRAEIEAGLREAIPKQQFRLHYQAQVTSNGDLTGVEALIRWEHPKMGMVLPDEFISVAEESGAILALGTWVLETACHQLALWAVQPEMAHLTISVNVSARQFHARDFVNQVLDILSSAKANPQRLKLELTEGLLATDLKDVTVKMTALKESGIGFSLDDFGTGYSSLSYLKRLPLDQLKIDKSFVRDLIIDPNDAAIANTVVALSQSLGLRVIAEGVETEAQRHLLASFGCFDYQGYLFSPPLPLEEFERFATKNRINQVSSGRQNEVSLT